VLEVRVYFILKNSLSVALNVAKRCEAVAYNDSGDILAIGNSNSVEIYCTFTL